MLLVSVLVSEVELKLSIVDLVSTASSSSWMSNS
jgi:hypothetical protein